MHNLWYVEKYIMQQKCLHIHEMHKYMCPHATGGS